MYPHDRFLYCLIARKSSAGAVSRICTKYGLPSPSHGNAYAYLRKRMGDTPSRFIKDEKLQPLFNLLYGEGKSDQATRDAFELLKDQRNRTLAISALQVLATDNKDVAALFKKYVAFEPTKEAIEKFRFYFWDEALNTGYRAGAAAFVREIVTRMREECHTFLSIEDLEKFDRRLDGLKVLDLAFCENTYKELKEIVKGSATNLNARLLTARSLWIGSAKRSVDASQRHLTGKVDTSQPISGEVIEGEVIDEKKAMAARNDFKTWPSTIEDRTPPYSPELPSANVATFPSKSRNA